MISQFRREHVSVAGPARQLGTTWRTVWRAIEPLLAETAADESRFAGVTSLGVKTHLAKAQARLASLRNKTINLLAGPSVPDDGSSCHLPTEWPWEEGWTQLSTAETGPPAPATSA